MKMKTEQQIRDRIADSKARIERAKAEGRDREQWVWLADRIEALRWVLGESI